MWYMVEVFKTQIWTSHATVGQRIHTTEKPYKYQECGNTLGLMRTFIPDRSQIYMCLLVRSLEHEFLRERFFTGFTNVTKEKNPILRAHVSPVGSEYLSWRKHTAMSCVRQGSYPKVTRQECSGAILPRLSGCGKSFTSFYVFSDDFSSDTQ